jgi:PAS domain-containing protein
MFNEEEEDKVDASFKINPRPLLPPSKAAYIEGWSLPKYVGEYPEYWTMLRDYRSVASRYCSLMMWLTSSHKFYFFFRMTLLSTDNPIIYASEGFSKFTGYSKEEIEGRNCRFLQGKDSNPDDVSRIREAIQERWFNFSQSGDLSVLAQWLWDVYLYLIDEYHLTRSYFLPNSFSSLPSIVMMEPLRTT